MVDIKYIARKCSVSTATVSRVLNHSKPVRPETEKKVLEAVKKYNYLPNSSARCLSGKKSNLLGFLLDNNINQYQLHLFREINTCSSRTGYDCIIRYCDSSFENKLEALKELEWRGIQVIFTMFLLDPEEEQYVKEHTRLHICNMQTPEIGLDLAANNQRAVYHGVNYLIERGHTKIGSIFYDDNIDGIFLTAREIGFRKALEHKGIGVQEKYICYVKNEVKREKISKLMEKLILPYDYPTAIFCCSDEIAIETMLWLMKHGYGVPEYVSVIGFDGIDVGEMLTPALTTIRQPIRYQAKQIVQNMLKLAGENYNFQTETEEGYRLIVRESTDVVNPK